MKIIQLFKDGKQIIATDGIMYIDGRFNAASIYREVRARNNRFAQNFPHKVADQYAIYAGRIGSNLGRLNNI